MVLFTENLEGEKWREIPNFTKYEASNFGSIRTKETTTVDNRGRKFINHSKLIKQTKNKDRDGTFNGYMSARLTDDSGNRGTRNVHRLIASTFIPNPKNLPTVNHIDGNKQNNNIKNLEWASYSNNNLHAYKNSLKTDNKKIVYINTFNNTVMGFYYSINEAARLTNVNKNMIYEMLQNHSEYDNAIFVYSTDFINNYIVKEKKYNEN